MEVIAGGVMDFKVNNREKRMTADGIGEVMLDSACELYPVFDDDLIMDVEVIDDAVAERIDRAAFAIAKQRGLDPIDPDDGTQWAEYIIGEVSAPVVLAQVATAAGSEGPGVSVTAETVYVGGEALTTFTVRTT
jgi:hypothetical protein